NVIALTACERKRRDAGNVRHLEGRLILTDERQFEVVALARIVRIVHREAQMSAFDGRRRDLLLSHWHRDVRKPQVLPHRHVEGFRTGDAAGEGAFLLALQPHHDEDAIADLHHPGAVVRTRLRRLTMTRCDKTDWNKKAGEQGIPKKDACRHRSTSAALR